MPTVTMPPAPIRIACGNQMTLTLNNDGTATFHTGTGKPVRVSAAQIETFAYQLANQLGDTR